MGPQQGQSSRDAHVEAIDLTLSSPEPEARLQHQANRPLQQQQPARVFKQEPGASYRSAHNGDEHFQRQGPTENGHVPQQQPRRINPQHLKQIIDTSSHRSLRHVVLQLCKTSPALSGALARGLAPHSPYAQQLIRGQQARPLSQSHHSHSQSHHSHSQSHHSHSQSHRSQAQDLHRSHRQSHHQIKTEFRPSGQDAYDRMKKRFGPSSSTQSPAARPNIHRPPSVQQNRDGLRLPSSHTAPKVKHEDRNSPTDSDDSTNIVDFPVVDRDARIDNSNTRASTGHVSRQRLGIWPEGEELTVRHRPAEYSAPDQKPKACLQCGELPKEGDVNCFYHTEHAEITGYDDIPKYMCCGRFEGEPGCKLGRHLYESTGILTNSKRPSPSSYGGSQWSKKPRVL